ncbi:MAG: ABC transporter ATP-binding protein [Methylocystaceae bacterium]
MAFLEIDNLSYTYPQSSRLALNNINLQINEGEIVLLVGGSGSGKTTLLRALCRLIPDFYGGIMSGAIQAAGKSLAAISRQELLQMVGMVYENPESQLVMTTVQQELAFGLENLGIPSSIGLNRLAETAEMLGLTPWLDQSTAKLSGGQKQKTALAAVMALQPKLLLLDEPTSRLNPVASEELFNFLRRLNEENGITIVIAEHRLEQCYHLADRVVFLDQGRISHNAAPIEAVQWTVQQGRPFAPPIPRLFAQMGSPKIPLTVKQARPLLGVSMPLPDRNPIDPSPSTLNNRLVVNKLGFAYPGGPSVLRGVSLNLPSGSITALMGANGSGKSTLGKNIAGLLKPSQGDICLDGRSIRGQKASSLAHQIGYLPQETGQYFFLATVKEEIEFNIKNLGSPDSKWLKQLSDWFSLTSIEDRYPRDLSRGEQQKAALTCVLLSKPGVLILDEPTQGLDPLFKEQLGTILSSIRREGTTILLITHDLEFVAEYADRAAFLQQGELIGPGITRHMISGHTFYSPQVNRLLGGRIITVREAQTALAGEMGSQPKLINLERS